MTATLRAFEAFARAQSAMYRGGDRDAVRELLAPDVVWHVPGESAIAGDHRGRDAVMAYFDRRRALAGGAMSILPGARLVSDDVSSSSPTASSSATASGCAGAPPASTASTASRWPRPGSCRSSWPPSSAIWTALP